MDTDVPQVVLVKEAPEEQSARIDKQDPEHFYMKEDLWTSLEGEQLHLKEKTNAASFPFTVASIKSEDDNGKHLFSQPHLQQIADRDVPTSSSADQMKAKAGGGAETSRNPHLNLHEHTSDSSEAEVSGDEEDDVNLDSKPETGDDDWNENRPSESDVKTVNKSFSCSECGKQVFQKCDGVKQHVESSRTVQKELNSFSCDDCSKRLGRQSDLNSHMQDQTGQKLFACELCDKTFCRKKTLNNHVRVHTGQKPFACELCDQRFTRQTYLNRHVRVHTGQKPFVCEVCGQSFRQKAHLKTHMRVHTGHMPFACEHCGQRFTRQTHLNRHMKIYRRCNKFSA
ncbi:gastrula zinc finger protein XlCGF8.2DB [Nothobranchius furzeri]